MLYYKKNQGLTFLIKCDNRKRKIIKMQVDKALYLKFPAVLRDKLLNNEIELPETTQFEYDNLYTYRAVERKADDYTEVTLEDFRSYFDLHKIPKTPRGLSEN